MNLDLARLRVEKWKTDSATKQQMQRNIDSMSANLGSAMPGMISQVRANPQSLAASFKLYRNVNVLSDVFSNLALAADNFAPRDEAQALTSDSDALNKVMRRLGDDVQSLAAIKDGEVTQLRTQLARATAPPPQPKKIIVDDEAKPAKKPLKKKKAPIKRTAPAESSKPQS